MNGILVVLMMIAAGAFVGSQSAINAALSRRVGIFEASFVSFTVGAVVLALIVLLAGKGNLRAAVHIPWWQWLGGLLGALYVTSLIIAVPRIGVAAAMVAAIAGQLATGMAIDHFGLFGVDAHPVDWWRILGIFTLLGSVWLIYGKR